MSFREKLSEWSGPITALVAVAALGVTGGYYTANSENAALTRDLNLANNGRGLAESIETIEQLSDAANNVFRFEQHAQEIAEMQKQIDALEEESKISQEQSANAVLALQEVQNRLAEAEVQVRELEEELQEKLSLREEFVLKEQTSRSFFESTQTVGLDAVYTNFVSANTPGGQDNLSTGEVQTWRTAHTLCKLTLTSMDAEENQASFLLVCS
jgi:hypothetical protein